MKTHEKMLLLRVASFHPNPLMMSQPSLASTLGMSRRQLQTVSYNLELGRCITSESTGRGNIYRLHQTFMRIADDEYKMRETERNGEQ